MADPPGRAFDDEVHKVTIVGLHLDVDARCCCGWISSLFPTREGAQQAAERHLAEVEAP